MAVFFVCLLAGWDTAATVAAVPFLVLVVVISARIIYRKSHGTSWADAWGRTPPDAK
jgi:hypothetical protein